MSDDLISRKAAVELVIAEYDRFQANGGSLSGRYELDKVIKMLEIMPTSFDKKKVIKKLKHLENDTFNYANRYDDNIAFGESSTFRAAIEIVEKGGLD